MLFLALEDERRYIAFFKMKEISLIKSEQPMINNFGLHTAVHQVKRGFKVRCLNEE